MTHLVVAVDQVDHVGDDGVARILGRLTHHPKVQVAQVARSRRQQIPPVAGRTLSARDVLCTMCATSGKANPQQDSLSSLGSPCTLPESQH